LYHLEASALLSALALPSIGAMFDIVEALRGHVGWNLGCVICFPPIEPLHVKIANAV